MMQNVEAGLRNRGRVLVVDDDPVALRLTRKRLERAGFEVHTRSEALGTTVAILELRPRFVVFDVQMPGLTGDQLARQIASNPTLSERVGVILQSSQDMLGLQDRARACGALGGIPKTPDDDYFLLQFERLVERAERGARRAEPR